MEHHTDEDALEFFNRLLERLHQADQTGRIELIYVASGAQHIDTIQTQNVYHAKRQEVPKDSQSRDLPEALSTDAAMLLWQKAQRAGYVDENLQPTISRTQSALLANAMAERLGIKEKWKVFESLWNRRNMYRDYYKALNLQQSLSFQDEIKRLFL